MPSRPFQLPHLLRRLAAYALRDLQEGLFDRVARGGRELLLQDLDEPQLREVAAVDRLLEIFEQLGGKGLRGSQLDGCFGSGLLVGSRRNLVVRALDGVQGVAGWRAHVIGRLRVPVFVGERVDRKVDAG